MEAIRLAKNAFDKLIKVCAIISTVSIVIIMLLNVVDTVFRWVEIPAYGIFELNGLLVGINLFLGLALVQKDRKHLSVNILGKYTAKWLRFIRSFVPLTLGAVFFGWLTYICWGKLFEAIASGEVIQGLVHFPLWPLKSAFAFGILLLTIQLIIDLILEIHKWRHPAAEITDGATS
jgi:TRAP-type C4-dicarboxylate transport system permease small subunit